MGQSDSIRTNVEYFTLMEESTSPAADLGKVHVMDLDEAFALQTGYDPTALNGRTVAFLVAPEGAEQSETLAPWEAVRLLGGKPVLISPKEGEAQLFDHLDRGERVPVQTRLDAADPDDYDALVLPGGVVNADELRTDPEAVRFAVAFDVARKPIAAICHAPWLLVEAGIVRDRMLTSWPSLHTDLTNAGAIWHDSPVVVDRDGPNALITSRGPGDLREFSGALADVLVAGG
jgi:protease I